MYFYSYYLFLLRCALLPHAGLVHGPVNERLALMIGRAHGTDLPWALQVRLPSAFAESMGKWSRKELARQGA